MTTAYDKPMPLLHTVRDTAALLGIGKSTIWAMIARGDLAVTKIGRRTLVRRSSIERLAGE
jgi:excisionase family DNA binding protein